MRGAPVALAFAFVLVGGACSDRGNVGADDGGVDANVQLDATAPQDASLQQDVGPQRDAPSANSDTGQSLVRCGTSSCNLALGEECCITNTTATCQAAGSCAGLGSLECDGPEDCFEAASPVCCGSITASGGGTSCTAAAGCTGNGLQLCHDDGSCAGTEKCCGSLAISGIDIRYCLPEADCTGTAAPGVPCGTGVVCNLPDACCVSQTPGCMAAASCTAGVAMLCDGPEDCQQDGGTGQVCCGSVTSISPIAGGSSCVTTCTPAGLIGGVLCHTNADCQSPQTCQTIGAMGYSLRLCRD